MFYCRCIKRKFIKFFACLALLVSFLALGTVLFFAIRPEGEFVAADSPPPAADSLEVRVLSWNVLQSESKLLGSPWEVRRDSFQATLAANRFDVICLQEALPEQLAFFSSVLPGDAVYGVGRDDGKGAGEHCPIFFNSTKYTKIDSGTFWLSPTPEKPSLGYGENVPRLCSWVELRDNLLNENFRIYNLHLQLNPLAQPKAAEVLKQHLAHLSVPAMVVGDFNAPHGWPALKVLEKAGFAEAEVSSALTYHVGGKGIRCLDHILTSPQWHVAGGGILKQKGGSVYPSDHFGLWAALVLR